jgi:hypothetical protein
LRQHCQFLTLAFSVEKQCFGKGLIKTNETAINAEVLSKNGYLEKICSVVQ